MLFIVTAKLLLIEKNLETTNSVVFCCSSKSSRRLEVPCVIYYITVLGRFLCQHIEGVCVKYTGNSS